MNKRLQLFFVLAFVLMAACSEADKSAPTTNPGQAVTTSTSISGSQLSSEPLPPPALAPGLTGNDLLAAIEGRWMCDVQRFAFSDLQAMNEALDERLKLSGLSRKDYDTFKRDLEARIDLREQVLVEYDAYCG